MKETFYERIGEATGVTATPSHQANADNIYNLLVYGSPGGSSGGWFPGADMPFIGVDGFCSPIGAGWESVVTSEFGYRSDPFTGETRGHTGMDLAVPTGTPIRAALPGTITVSQYSSSYGYYVMIDHGNGLSTLYGQNSQLLAQVGFHCSGADYTNRLYPESEMRALEPDVIFSAEADEVETVKQSYEYKVVAAVKNDKVMAIDFTAFQNQSLRMFDTLAEMAKFTAAEPAEA